MWTQNHCTMHDNFHISLSYQTLHACCPNQTFLYIFIIGIEISISIIFMLCMSNFSPDINLYQCLLFVGFDKLTGDERRQLVTSLLSACCDRIHRTQLSKTLKSSQTSSDDQAVQAVLNVTNKYSADEEVMESLQNLCRALKNLDNEASIQVHGSGCGCTFTNLPRSCLSLIQGGTTPYMKQKC